MQESGFILRLLHSDSWLLTLDPDYRLFRPHLRNSLNFSLHKKTYG